MTRLERMMKRAEEMQYQLQALSVYKRIPKYVRVVCDELEQQAEDMKEDVKKFVETDTL